ncbi:MAG: hypothetical protein LLG00_13295 [Planctomycetaceae bacterium]|nr:hypothetical protein [Planctomycetaceae bacterium]
MNRPFVALIVILVVIAVVLAATGVLRFHNTKDESAVTVDKKLLKEQTEEALDKAGQTLRKAAGGLQGSEKPGEQKATPESPSEAPPRSAEHHR